MVPANQRIPQGLLSSGKNDENTLGTTSGRPPLLPSQSSSMIRAKKSIAKQRATSYVLNSSTSVSTSGCGSGSIGRPHHGHLHHGPSTRSASIDSTSSLGSLRSFSTRGTRTGSLHNRHHYSNIVNSRRKSITSASDFVNYTKSYVEFEMSLLQNKLDLLDALSNMSDEEKIDLLFDLLDKDNDKSIDAMELAEGLRNINAISGSDTGAPSTSNDKHTFQQCLNIAISRIATADITQTGSLNKSELTSLVYDMSNDIGCTVTEFTEMMTYVILDNEMDGDDDDGEQDDNVNDFVDHHDNVEETNGNMSKEKAAQAVRNEKEYRDYMMKHNKRLRLLFEIFDVDGDGTVDFKEFVWGVYKLTEDVEDRASKAAMAAMLMFDDIDATPTTRNTTNSTNRTLDYKSFCMLMINLITTAIGNNTSDDDNDDDGFVHVSPDAFDDALDSLILTISSETVIDQEKQSISIDNMSKEFALGEDKMKNLLLMSERHTTGSDNKPSDNDESVENDNLYDRELSALEYSKIYKLFELWDTDGDSYIDFDELMVGIKKFHRSNSKDSSNKYAEESRIEEECIAIIKKFDENDDLRLDFGEFVTFITKFASMNKIANLHEFLDFMIVCTTIKRK